MNITKLTLLAIAVSTTVACTQQVPPGKKGKVLGINGYNPELLDTGRHSVWGRDSLVIVDVTTNVKNVSLSVTMNDTDSAGNRRQGLTMDFILSFRFRLKSEPTIINTMFNDIDINPDTGVTASQVLGIYAMPDIETAFRDVVSRYTPEGAMANRAEVNNKVSIEIQKRLEKSPIEVSNIVVKKMILPTVIKDRIVANKNRELQNIEEQAKQAIELTKRENAIVLAHKDAERNLIDAEAAAAQNKALLNGLTPEVLELRKLEIAKIYAEAVKDRMANGTAGDVVFMPFDAMNTTGGQIRILNSK